MEENEILNQLTIIKTKFDSDWQEWSRLGQAIEFRDLSHTSSIRELFNEGKGYTGYLITALPNSDVGKYALITEYVERVRNCITPYKDYLRIKERAKKEYEEELSNNWTVMMMLRLYTQQEGQIALVEKLLVQLSNTPTYRLLVSLPHGASPTEVIFAWSKMWEEDSHLHRNLGENALRSQLTAALRSAGIAAVSEAHAYQGHADIVVPPEIGNYGNKLVVECKIWSGEKDFESAVSQLCRYVTANDDHAALVMFVRQNSFREIVSKACEKLKDHECFHGWNEHWDTVHEFTLSPAQDSKSRIPATLVMCNLAIERY